MTLRSDELRENPVALTAEIVVVSYRSRHQIEGLLAGLPADLPVVFVDNTAGADGLAELAQSRPGSRYLDGGGRGFAHAANLGAASSVHDHLIFINPDSRPTAKDLAALIDDLVDDPTCASSAATMVGADGEIEIGVGGWEPSLRRAVVHALGLHKRRPLDGLFAKPAPHEQIGVDWTTGAVMAVRRSTFAQLGAFDESFYVYNEDVAFGRTVRARGMHQVLRTDLLVPHSAGGSGAPSLEMMRLRGASMARYVGRHHGVATALAIRLVLALGYGLRVLEQLVARDVPRAREHASYVVGVLTGRARVGGVEVARTGGMGGTEK